MIVIIIIFIYYNYFIYEKFNNYNQNLINNELDKIKNNPNDINKIKTSFDIILNLINDPNSKIKISNIYYSKLVPIINTNTNKNSFDVVIKEFQNAIDDYLNLNTINDAVTAIIIKDINSLLQLYKGIYIDKVLSLNQKQIEINNLNMNIYNSFLRLTTNEDLYNSGIVLILNTTLKRAYEDNNYIYINSNINTLLSKLKSLNVNANVETAINHIYNINPSPIQVTYNENQLNNEFSNIKNYFELLVILYKNKENRDVKQITTLTSNIYNSLNIIANYNPKYTNIITSIINVIIKPIIDIELNNNNVIPNFDDLTFKFNNAILSIKNITLNYINNQEFCLNNITKEILNGNFPIQTEKINNCDKRFFNNKNLILYPKLTISSDKGKTWNLANDLYENKNNSPFVYTYQIASSTDEGNQWNIMKAI
jgi:hypothetical protein